MNKKSLKLYCFSPPVMLATLIVELVFAVYVLLKYASTQTSRLVIIILVCLAVFQATEYMLCGVNGISGGVWSRIGYSAITLLPPLGIHLALTIAGKQEKWLVRLAYTTAAMFVAYFASWLYAAYYYGWLAIGTALSMYYGMKSRVNSIRRALYALAVGYAAFIVPTTTLNLIDPTTIHAIPSIMCGFAVLLAFVLVGKVMPETNT